MSHLDCQGLLNGACGMGFGDMSGVVRRRFGLAGEGLNVQVLARRVTSQASEISSECLQKQTG